MLHFLYFNHFSQSCCNGVTLSKLYRHGLYVCIILETAHHRTTFGIFSHITHKTIPEENSCKKFHISSLIKLFSYGKVKDNYVFFGYKDQISSERAKGRGKRGYGGESQNELFLQNSHY